MNQHLPVSILQTSVTVPAAPREVDLNDVSLDASTLWHLIDHLENRMGDADGQEEAALLVRLARMQAYQIDQDLRALSGALR